MFHPPSRLTYRAFHYNCTFGPKYPGSALSGTDRFIYGTWFLGNAYKGSGFFGAYPPEYLKRVAALFPDTPEQVLHLFSGSLPKSNRYVRFDIKQKADVQGNAEQLSKHFRSNSFDVIYADPPYSKEAAIRYGTPMPNRKKVLEQCAKVLRPGGFVLWLDTVWPMVAKTKLELVGTISLFRSSNHVVRATFLFRKPLA